MSIDYDNCYPGVSQTDETCWRFTDKSNQSQERVLFDNWWRETINQFGIKTRYFVNSFTTLSADNLYGEQPTKSFTTPIEFVMGVNLNENAIQLSKFGFMSDDEITAYIHIDSFSTSFQSLSDTFNDQNSLIEPKAGDVFQLSEYGDTRPGRRQAKYFEVTEKLDEDIAQINPLAGHYVFLVKAKRFDASFEPGIDLSLEKGTSFDIIDSSDSTILSDLGYTGTFIYDGLSAWNSAPRFANGRTYNSVSLTSVINDDGSKRWNLKSTTEVQAISGLIWHPQAPPGYPGYSGEGYWYSKTYEPAKYLPGDLTNNIPISSRTLDDQYFFGPGSSGGQTVIKKKNHSANAIAAGATEGKWAAYHEQIGVSPGLPTPFGTVDFDWMDLGSGDLPEIPSDSLFYTNSYNGGPNVGTITQWGLPWPQNTPFLTIRYLYTEKPETVTRAVSSESFASTADQAEAPWTTSWTIQEVDGKEVAITSDNFVNFANLKGNQQVYEGDFAGKKDSSGNPVTEAKKDKYDVYDIDEISKKDIFDMSDNDTDVYGDYY